jgi:hypothetical protein
VFLRDADRDRARWGFVGVVYLVVVVADGFTVDAMSSLEVAAWFWLLVGMVGRWRVELPPPRPAALPA